MWSIARIDYELGKTESPFLNSLGLFKLIWAYRKRDLPSFREVRQDSGFCCPTDDLALVGPDGRIRTVDERSKKMSLSNNEVERIQEFERIGALESTQRDAEWQAQTGNPNFQAAMKLYSTKQAAAHLGMGESALKYHVYQGNIKPRRVGHSLVFTQAQLDEFQSTRRPRGRPRSREKGR